MANHHEVAHLWLDKAQDNDRHGEQALELAKVHALLAISDELELLREHLQMSVDQTAGL